MTADAYLPHTVHDVPVAWMIDADGVLFERVRHYVRQGVVRVIAGPEACHVIVDVQRPYYRPAAMRALPSPDRAAPKQGETT